MRNKGLKPGTERRCGTRVSKPRTERRRRDGGQGANRAQKEKEMWNKGLKPGTERRRRDEDQGLKPDT